MIAKEWMTEFFEQEFGRKPRCFRSPGRINLIGEHTDYNEGFVLPAGIDLFCNIAITPSDNGSCTLIAYDLGEKVTFSEFPDAKSSTFWANYIIGVSMAFKKRGFELPHFNAAIRSEIPVGAGLSSSAALESVFAFAFNEIFNCGLSSLELTKIAQESENEFIGLQCGIMDMFASIHAKKDKAIRLDCRSLEYEYITLDLGKNKLLLFDTAVKHELASSEYNNRRLECTEVVNTMKYLGHQVNSLRDVSLEMLYASKEKIDPTHYQRAKHVVEENKRLHDFSDAVASNNWALAGDLLYASHHSLKNDYEVSCDELNLLVDTVKDVDGVWGARMMGGGFGGCTLNLVEADKVDVIIENVNKAYSTVYGFKPKHYIAGTSDGAAEF
jgi:galactokinase